MSLMPQVWRKWLCGLADYQQLGWKRRAPVNSVMAWLLLHSQRQWSHKRGHQEAVPLNIHSAPPEKAKCSAVGRQRSSLCWLQLGNCTKMGFMACHTIIKGGTPHITCKRRTKVFRSYILLTTAFVEDNTMEPQTSALHVTSLLFSAPATRAQLKYSKQHAIGKGPKEKNKEWSKV